MAGYPRIVIFSVLALTGICSIGFLSFLQETRPEKLWIPQGTLSLDHQNWVAERFNDGFRVGEIIVKAKEDLEDKNIASKAYLLQLVDLLEDVLKVQVELNGEAVQIEDLCLIQTSPSVSYCSITSVLDLFYDSSFENSASNFWSVVRTKLLSLSNDQVLSVLSNFENYKTWNNRPMSPKEFIGGYSVENNVLVVESFRIVSVLNNIEIESEGKSIDYRAEKWERAWVDRILNYSNAPNLSIFVSSLVSELDALANSLSGETYLIFFGCILLTIYIFLTMGELHTVKSRVLLGIGSLMSVSFAILSTFGICSAMGMFFGPVHQALPVLMFGIGMDDAFVLLHEFDALENLDISIRERLARAVSASGAALTVTTLTNASAFFISSISTIPALKYFALWAAIGLILDYFYCLTLFATFLYFDGVRQSEKRKDVFPCFVSKDVSETNICGGRFGTLSYFFENFWCRFFLDRRVIVVFFTIAFALFSVCLWGVSQLQQKFQLDYFFQEGTFLKDFSNEKSRFFPSMYVPLFIYTGDFDYRSFENQRKMNLLFGNLNTTGLIESNPFTIQTSLDSWWVGFRVYLGMTSPEEFIEENTFYSSLNNFLSSPYGKRFSPSIILSNGRVVATRNQILVLNNEDNNDEQVDAMKSIRQSVESAGLPVAFPFTNMYVYFEQYAVIKQETITTVASSLAIVFVVSFLLIGNPLTALVTLLGVALSVVDILGIVHFWDINLNSVSVINLALVVGLTIDFSAHIGLSFMEAVGTRVERAKIACTKLGPPLVHGGISTTLAIFPLVAAKSYVFGIFSRMFFLIIAFGMFHGLIIVPQILSLLGPTGFFRSQNEKETRENAIYERLTGPHLSPNSNGNSKSDLRLN